MTHCLRCARDAIGQPTSRPAKNKRGVPRYLLFRVCFDVMAIAFND